MFKKKKISLTEEKSEGSLIREEKEWKSKENKIRKGKSS